MAYSTVKYVNPESGIDTNDGSALAPYKTLDKADTVATPSTKVYLRGGTYREYFEPSTSGASGTDNDIVYEAYPGEEPLFLGDQTTTPIVKVSGTTKYLTFRGIQARWGYTKPPDNNYKFAFFHIIGSGVQNIVLDRLILEREGYDNMPALYNTKWNEWGAIIDDATNCEIKNTTIRGVRKGLHIKGAALNTWVHNNLIGPTVQSGIVISGSSGGVLSNTLVSFNKIFGSYIEDGIQALPGQSGIDNAPTDNWGVIVYANDIYDHNENAVDLKGTQFWVVEGNYIWGIKGSNNGPIGGWDKSGFAIMRGANQDAYDHIIRDNIIWDGGGGIAMRGDGWKVYNNVVLYNNSNYLGPNQSYGDFTFKGILNVESKQRGAIKNNIAYGTEGYDIAARLTDWSSSGDVDIDYNLGLVWADITYPSGSGTRYTPTSIRTALAATSWNTEGEAHNKTGSWADLGFTNLPQRPVGPRDRGDFRILATSIAYQAGGWLTKTNGTGASSATLIVDDSGYFREDAPLRVGDKIFFNGQERRVIDNDRDTNTLTLDSPASWSDNQPVYLGTSASPNMGATAPTGVAGIDGTDTGSGGGEPPPDPPPSGSGGPGFIGLGFAAANTSTGTQFIPITSPTGDPPVAVEFFAGYAVTDGTSADVAALSIGAVAVVSGDQYAFSSRSNHGSADSYCHRRSSSTSCILLNNAGATSIYAEAAFDSADETGVSVNWTTAPAAAILVGVRAYYGEEAHVEIAATNGTVDAAVAVTPGFTPNVVRVASNGKPLGSFSHCRLSYGLATVTSDVITQQVDAWTSAHASATGAPSHIMINGRVSSFTTTGGALQWALEMTDLLDTTFNLRTRDGTPSEAEEVGVLCVRFAADVWSGIIDIPATATSTPYTSIGWRPAYLDMIAGFLTSLGAGDTGHDGGAYGIGSYMDDAGGTRWGISVAEEDGAATMNTESRADSSRFLNIPTDAGSDTNAIRADTVTMLDNGFQVNWDVVPGTSVRKAIAFAIRSAQSITPAFEGDVLSGTTPLTVTFTNNTTAEGLTVPDDITWAWDFGDGDTSTDYEPEHIYDVAGVYTVTLTASAGSLEEVYTLENYIIVESAVNIGAAALSGHGAALIAAAATESGFGTALIAPLPDAPGFGGALLS